MARFFIDWWGSDACVCGSELGNRVDVARGSRLAPLGSFFLSFFLVSAFLVGTVAMVVVAGIVAVALVVFFALMREACCSLVDE